MDKKRTNEVMGDCYKIKTTNNKSAFSEGLAALAENEKLKQQIEEAHAQLDLLDTPRRVGRYRNQVLTIAGRLEWLIDKSS